MNIDLTGKRAIVTGGSRGIGRATALAFAAAGADVSICARGAELLEAARTDIARHKVTAHAAICDLADGEAVRRYIAETAEALGGIDILVNNASGFGSTDDEAGWEKSLSVDLMATVRATQAATPHLEKSDAAAILNISSTAAFHPSVRSTPYGVAKSAVIQYTRNRAAALAPQRIRVNCIAPGSIEFPGGNWEKRKTDNPQLYNSILRGIPFGRLGHPEGRAGRAVSGVAACRLGHRPDDHGRRRPDAGAVAPCRSPTQVGAHCSVVMGAEKWIPAFAGRRIKITNRGTRSRPCLAG